jgi:phosphoadenosine phosphosulfate reductase
MFKLKRTGLYLDFYIQEAIEFIKANEPSEGYLLGFSGGKDSQVIYELAKMSKIKFHAYFGLTSIDPPEVIKFVRDYYPEIEIKQPPITIFALIAKRGYGYPPTSRWRYCCKYLKEIYDGHIITGIRASESMRRSKRKRIEYVKSNHILYNPIFNWTENEVWEFHRKFNLPHCKLYDEGFTRIGCIGCPMKTPKQREADFIRWPNYYRAYLFAFDKMLRNRKRPSTIWQSGQDVMDWWLKRGKSIPEGNSC